MKFHELLKFVEEEDLRLIEHYGKEIDKQKMTLARTVKLSEEVGELSNEILTYLSLQRKDKLSDISENKTKLAKEMADVLIVTLLIAKSTGVDIEKALEEKISEIKKRNYTKNTEK
jgi:NTP pyrophosphatase (non-canonical NTP hydrolase)